MFDPVEAVKAFVRCPSVSTDLSFAEGMASARNHLCGLFHQMGLSVEVVATPRHPIVIAERAGAAGWPHIIVYGHYDVQPADPLDLWESRPFEPEVRDGYLYGRGVADNKGPLLVHVSAVGRLLEAHPDVPLGITFLVEGEEEIGSPSFAGFLKRARDRLAGDFVLLSDTQSPRSDQVAITVGLRGIICLNVELVGPAKDLHSGVYGGAVYNPIQALAELCSTLHNADGRVNLPGFYDDVVDVAPWEREELKKVGFVETEYAEFLGVSAFHTSPGLGPFEAVRFAPTLDFNGIGGGYQGDGTKTVIPSRAFAKISCRLVPNQDPERIQGRLVQTLRDRCTPKVSINFETEHCGAPYRVAPPDKGDDSGVASHHLRTAFRAADSSINEVFGRRPVYLCEGGSVPVIPCLKETTGMDSLMIGMCTPESNLHAPNENLPLDMFVRGIEVSERIFRAVAGI